jgi:neopullulanase
LPGAPCIYYGDELGMEGHHDPDCRRSYPAGPLTAEQTATRAFVRDLVGARHASRALRDGALRFVGTDGDTVAMLRTSGADTFVVVANASTIGVTLDLALDGITGIPAPVLLAGWEPSAERSAAWSEPGRLSVRVPARSGLIVRLDGPAV